jgi:AAA15 family ATPase/GTPase
VKGVIEMAIEKITLKNFTVFDELEIDFCEGINVLLGENGTGKTHLLKVLYAFYQTDVLNHIEDNDKLLQDALEGCFQIDDLSKLINEDAYSTAVKTSFEVSFTSSVRRLELNLYSTKEKNKFDKLEADVKQTLLGSGETEEAIPPFFIPVKEMLTHARLEKDFMQRVLPFDITLIDVLHKAGVSKVRKLEEYHSMFLNEIRKIINGKVVFKNEHYYIERDNGTYVDFSVEAESFKKLGLIYRLIETGYLIKGGVLFWDEPEANMNPKNIPLIADILLALQRQGVQIFIATHDYFLPRYLDVRKTNEHKLCYYALHKNEEGRSRCEREEDFDMLENNSILSQFTGLYEEEITR